MASGSFVLYTRVSTREQCTSGLGLEAQRAKAMSYLNGGDWRIVAEFQEVESGKNNQRPQLARAMAECRLRGATLLIAKLDRLSRDAHFLLGLEKAGVDFVCADMPSANKLTVGIMAVVAEQERELISQRTKDALAARKARGLKLGNPANLTAAARAEGRARAAEVKCAKASARWADLAPILAEIRSGGARTQRAIADALNGRGIPTPRGGRWSGAQVHLTLKQMGG